MQTALIRRSDVRNGENVIRDTIKRAFNAIGRAHIQSGHKTVLAMELDGKIRTYKVDEAHDDYAIISRGNETFGVTFDG